MDLHQLLDHLDDNGARLLVRGDRLVLAGPARVRTDHAVVEVIATNKLLLVFHVIGTSTGHAIGFCTVCGAASMTHYRPSDKHPLCRMTPGCAGRHQPRQADVSRLAAKRAPGRPTVPPPPPNPPTKPLLGPVQRWPEVTR